MIQQDKIQALEAKLAYQFQDAALLVKALKHPVVNSAEHNENIEFLGDRVLGLVIAEYLFQRHQTEPEGELARRLAFLGSGELCGQIASTWQLPELVNISSELFTDRVLANYCEAIIGAIYLDGGFSAVRAVILHQWRHVLDDAPPVDAKTVLQEWAMKKGVGLPLYERLKEEGPPHAPEFTYRVSIEGVGAAEAKGPSRRKAEQAAARCLLDEIGELS